MNEAEKAREHLRATARELEQIYALLGKAGDAQWERPSVLPTAFDGNQSNTSKSMISDPTGDIATNPTRLNLRKRVRETESVLHSYEGHIRGLRERLESELRPWV